MLLFWSSMWLSVFTEPCWPAAWFCLRCRADEALLVGLKQAAALNTCCHIIPIIRLSRPSPPHGSRAHMWAHLWRPDPLQLLDFLIGFHPLVLPCLANPLVSMDQEQCWLRWHLYFDRNQPTVRRHSAYRDRRGYSEQCQTDTLTVWLTRCDNRNGRHECPLSLAVFCEGFLPSGHRRVRVCE